MSDEQNNVAVYHLWDWAFPGEGIFPLANITDSVGNISCLRHSHPSYTGAVVVMLVENKSLVCQQVGFGVRDSSSFTDQETVRVLYPAPAIHIIVSEVKCVLTCALYTHMYTLPIGTEAQVSSIVEYRNLSLVLGICDEADVSPSSYIRADLVSELIFLFRYFKLIHEINDFDFRIRNVLNWHPYLQRLLLTNVTFNVKLFSSCVINRIYNKMTSCRV